jgi:1-acyl-sn-glycerol-3-phosphate acyltransferase
VPDRQTALTQINLDDLVAALGLQNRPRLARLARRLLRVPAAKFARQMVEFDDAAGLGGLPEGARLAQKRLARDVRVHGREHLPKGGFLALSNHPGLTDTLALFASLDRDDLMTIALHRPFLANLEHVSKNIFYLSDAPQERMALVRQVARALKAGTAVLTFPAGHIEPDPDVFPGAVESLANWTQSAEVFLRLTPGTPVVPVCVRGVSWKWAARNPLARARRTSEERQLLASALQLLWQLLLGARLVNVDVQIGEPTTPVLGSRFDGEALHRAVVAEMRRLIESTPYGPGESAL